MKKMPLALLLALLPSQVQAYSSAEIASEMAAREKSLNACMDASTGLRGQTGCVRDALDSLKIYKEKFYGTFYSEVLSGQNGLAAHQELEATEKMWIQYRRDMCNFAAEARTDDRDYAAFRGVMCVFKVTVARMRELAMVE